MNRPNKIVVMNMHDGHFKDNVQKALEVLLDCNEEQVIFEFADADRSLGDIYPYWLSTEEFEQIDFNKYEQNLD